ncbi:MAG: rRNA ((967)-C(5))-methyltransferase [Clostridia bacterium]|jgi:16S rRNA (cytosine967-C5)-methyltransferase|nr:rRNA ((967)-C(5))-methyltransferase [Clostridia bacterium]
MDKNVSAREAAVLIVQKVLRENAYSNIALRRGLEQSSLSRVDKSLVTEIVNGTLKNLIKIDWIASQFIKIKQNKLDKQIQDIIRTGIYQIMYLDRIPDSAVCNESANLARKLGNEGAVKFVNGVLRNISRSKDSIKYPDKEKEPVQFLSVFYSHPEWIVKKWLEDYGYDFTEQLLAANNEVPHFTIRANRLKTDRESLKQILRQEEIEYSDGLYNEEALYIKGTSSIEEKQSFKDGLYQIQDESSMLIGHVLDPKPGELIIDACSAPGGKATHAAELMGNNGIIIARDIHKHKLELIQQSCRRLGIDIVKTQLFNAKDLDESLVDRADRVLLDAPCSGLGVLRRKPDLRWKKSPDNFSELSELQLEILHTVARYVKPQGVLVYSTCTINKSENIDVIERFLEENREFYLEDLTGLVPANLESGTKSKGYIEIFPHIHGIDGFFIARLRRR